MKKKLIVVCDDFGFSMATSIGAIKAYNEGIVTVLSLMSNMETAEFAVKLAKEHCPKAQITLHANFVQGKSVGDGYKTLTKEDGSFYGSAFWKGGKKGSKHYEDGVNPSADELAKELKAQVIRTEELTDQPLMHMEGHSVVTRNIQKAFAQVNASLSIHSMFLSGETEKFHYAHELGFDNGTRYFEILHSGFTPELFVQDPFGLLKSKHEYNVLHFHPGYLDAFVFDNSSLREPRVRDLETLTSPLVKDWLDSQEIELVDFTALLKN